MRLMRLRTLVEERHFYELTEDLKDLIFIVVWAIETLTLKSVSGRPLETCGTLHLSRVVVPRDLLHPLDPGDTGEVR